MNRDLTFLSRRTMGAEGVPTPLSPLKMVCPVVSRSEVNVAMSSQNLIDKTRKPSSFNREHSASI
jgi:hypothetical protein